MFLREILSEKKSQYRNLITAKIKVNNTRLINVTFLVNINNKELGFTCVTSKMNCIRCVMAYTEVMLKVSGLYGLESEAL